VQKLQDEAGFCNVYRSKPETDCEAQYDAEYRCPTFERRLNRRLKMDNPKVSPIFQTTAQKPVQHAYVVEPHPVDDLFFDVT